MKDSSAKAANFVRTMVSEHLEKGRYQHIVTRFPPEPNGYLHIGHAKSICLNFGIAEEFKGQCHLRFDDTNPTKEDIEFVESIQRDIRWLGFDWNGHLHHASDYFEKLYQFAVNLINVGKAYVDSLNEEEIREYRGTVKEAGRPSPYRDRSIEENLDLFQRMRAGEFADGAHVLRAKIDMGAANMKMRDPLLYRIRHAHHYRSGADWCVYPMYDFAHCLSDSIEGITHSVCTLEFENNRDIYDWVLENTPEVPTRTYQYEFARLNLNYTVMSKRKLLTLVQDGLVNGWDDPRMPTIAGMRRRGYTPEALRDFCERIGVAKANSTVDFSQLEFSVRNDLNHRAPRIMSVLNPLKVTINNYPEGKAETFIAASFPPDVGKEGSREIPFSGSVYIDRDDFSEEPPAGWHRLAPGREVRLRHGYVIKCEEVMKDEKGEISELICSYDPETLGVSPKGRKVKGAIHWVPANEAVPAEVRLYDRLFTHEKPDGDKDVPFTNYLNPESLITVQGLVEPSAKNDPAGSFYQFERLGFFCSDHVESTSEKLVYNRTVPLRDSFGKPKEEAKPVAKPKAKKKPEPAIRVEKDITADLSESQLATMKDLCKTHQLSEADAVLLVDNQERLNFFQAAVNAGGSARGVANMMVNELLRVVKDTPLVELPFKGEALGHLVKLQDNNTISSKIAKQVFEIMIEKGGEPEAIVEAQGLKQLDNEEELSSIVDGILADNPNEVTRYREGNKKLMGFFVGRAMKATGGKANPGLLNKLLKTKLDQ